MLDSSTIWQVLAGVGIFLVGIRMLEMGLKQLMGRGFKLFLQKQTGNPVKAIVGGAFITALLQSSSAVNFMVLAFVSTGVLSLQNAFALIMGNNLGSTVSGWIIVTLGFKFNIEVFAFPLIGIAGICWFIFIANTRLQNVCMFLIGFSFIFIGLGYMNSAIGNEKIQNIFSRFDNSSNGTFLFIGFIITTITQSSSATVAITLSMLHQQLIGFDAAMAVVIGSEVGTSLKLILGSLDGIAVKKRVSAGNIIYNLITTAIAFGLLQQIAFFITETMSV
ncbi:MAG: Na/Pi cotransporter family protein, partial [Chitinophagales bacterium]